MATKSRKNSLARPRANSVVGSSFRAAGEALHPKRMGKGSGSYRGSLSKANNAIGDSFGAAGKHAFKPKRKVKMGRK